MKIITGASCGFYCVVTWHVLRNLRKWKEIEGQKVNISLQRNVYSDFLKGSNVWEYYYKQIDKIEGTPQYIYERDMPDLVLYPNMNIRETLGILYKKYVNYNELTQKIIAKSLSPLDQFNSILGVHIRKTDKYNEEPESYPIDDVDVLNVVNKALSEKIYDKIYLATDDQETYDLFLKTYGNLVFKIDRIRSTGDKSVHHHMPEKSGYVKGLEAILDMEALSRCKFLVRCTSNLSATSMIVKQDLECYNLNTIFRNDIREQKSFDIYSKTY